MVYWGRKIVRGRIKADTQEVKRYENILEFNISGFRSYPIFEQRGSIPSCLQEKIFGFYALVEILVAVMQSINFLIGANACQYNKLFAPSTVLAYSAAFHLVRAYNAINGRICMPMSIYNSSPQSILCRIRRDNRWNFENQPTGHRSFWQHYLEVLKQEPILPESIYELFQHWYGNKIKPGFGMDEFLEGVEVPRYSIGEVLDEVVARIAATRHIAVYQGIGEDPEGLDSLANDKDRSLSEEILSGQADAMLRYANRFSIEVSKEILDILQCIEISDDLRDKIAIRTVIRHDMPRLELLPVGEIRSNFEKLQGLTNPWLA